MIIDTQSDIQNIQSRIAHRLPTTPLVFVIVNAAEAGVIDAKNKMSAAGITFDARPAKL
jgi:hypothetical protein